MKILLCSVSFQHVVTGPAKFAQILCCINDLFPDNEVRVLTEGVKEGVRGSIYKLTLNYPRPVHALGQFLRAWSYYKAAIEVKKEYPYEVIVFNDSIVGLLSGWLMPESVKVVSMINADKYLCTDLSGFYWSRKWLIKMFYKPIEMIALLAVDQVITCSDYLRQKVINSYKVNLSKIATLHQAVDKFEPAIRRRNLGKGKSIKILFVKNDFERAGLEHLVRALALLGSFKFELIIIGPLLEWRSQVEKLYLPVDNIRYTFLGPQSQEEVFKWMRNSDILCIPSLREALGVANMEGLADGIPVVTTNVGGIPEVLGNGAYGWLAEPGNPESLAKTIKACMDNPTLRFEKSKAGHQFVKERFGYEKVLERFIQILKED